MTYRHGSNGFASRLGSASLLLSLAAFGAGSTFAGCADEASHHGGNSDVDQVGSLDLNLNVAPGITINAVSYEISGNGFSKSGTIDASASPVISAKIGGIPAGKGYTIKLTASSAEGTTTFTGSAQFDVTAGGTSSVTVRLRGTTQTGNGSVTVTGTINVNPVIDELSVSALTVHVGSSIALSAVGRDPDQQPAAVTYYWSTNGGVIDNPVSPNATLTSSGPGTFTVTLTVSDGDGSTSTSQNVTFVKPDAGDAGVGDAGPEKPNVLLIIADDLGAASTSLYPQLAGDTGAVPVPNIEALAQNGLVFDNAWSSPACSPTRGTIISGQYGYRTGVTNVGDVLPTSTVSLFDRFTSDSPNYAQAFLGKYHVGGGSIDPRPGVNYPGVPAILQHIRDIGITSFRGILGGAVDDYFNWVTYDINGPSIANTTYATTYLADQAIDFIQKQKSENPDKPWFLYQSFNAPHAAAGGNAPYQVPPANLHSVDLSSVGNPAPGQSATNIPIYKADIQALDTELGRLLKEVDLTTTTVIFIGDNGVPPPVTDVGQELRGSKGSVYEGGVRVPLVVAGAGVTRRGREESLFVAPDIYATVLDISGANVKQVNDSYSVKPLLTDEAAVTGRAHSYTEIGKNANHQYALRDTRFKLVKNAAGRALYDLVADPLETTNLYASAPHAAARASLENELTKLKTGASPVYFQ